MKKDNKEFINKLTEAKEYVEPSVAAKIQEIIDSLIEENFTNKESRQKFVDLLYNLVELEKDSDDRRTSVRKFFKYVSDAISDYEKDIKDDSDVQDASKTEGGTVKSPKVESVNLKEAISKSQVKEVLKLIKKVIIVDSEGPSQEQWYINLKGKEFKSPAEATSYLKNIPKPEKGYWKMATEIVLEDGTTLTGYRYDHGKKDPDFMERLLWYLENRLTFSESISKKSPLQKLESILAKTKKYLEADKIDTLIKENPEPMIEMGERALKERKEKKLEELQSVEVTYEDGTKMVTSVSDLVDQKDIEDYYVGKRFDLGVYPKEKMVKAVSVRFV